MELSALEILQRIGMATVLGGLVGLERELHGQAAGLRTHVILAIGASLASIISVNAGILGGPGADPGRISAQVVSGIGFLGAGAIIRYGGSNRGLTTATSLWTIAIVGLACGMGGYQEAAIATALVFLSLTVLDLLEKRVLPSRNTHQLIVLIKDKPGITRDMESMLAEHGMRVISSRFQKTMSSSNIELDLTVKVTGEVGKDRLIGVMSKMDGIESFQVSLWKLI